MIVLDSSAVAAILLREPESEIFSGFVVHSDCIIGAPTLLEVSVVTKARASDAHRRELDRILALPNLAIVAFEPAHVQAAHLAYEQFGRGFGHPARLNFGDCMAYAVAKLANAPLLFKGDDFVHTDITPAYNP